MYDRVIVDEDILRHCLIMKALPISDLADLRCEADKTKDKSVAGILDTILAEVEQSGENGHNARLKLVDEQIQSLRRFCMKHSQIGEKLTAWLDSDWWVVDGERIAHIRRLDIPDTEVVVLSATASPEVYRWAYPGRQPARGRGIPLQSERAGAAVSGTTFSRHALRTRGDRIMEMVRKMAAESASIVSFKESRDLFGDEQAHHFGALEGLNDLEGRDIAIVGTPHYPPVLYRLMALALGRDTSCFSFVRAYATVQHNGFEFTFFSFVDSKDLLDLQLWLIESQLVQAIGRARVLRNNCTVYLFSDLPVLEADEVTVIRM